MQRFEGTPHLSHTPSNLDRRQKFPEAGHPIGPDALRSDALINLRNVRAPHRERVRVGLASMPGREKTLAQVLRCISPQVDEVFVYLNDMATVPLECAAAPDNVHFFTGPDLGDRGKFMFVENFTGYYITVDDDILYPEYYVASLIDGIERHHRRAIVGWHGSIIEDDIQRYYRSKSRRILSFSRAVDKDTPVHILGTGTTGFHTDTIGINHSEFIYPNMADVFLALAARRLDVPMVVLAHQADEAIPLDTADSISTVSLGDQTSDRAQRLDMSEIVTRIVKEHVPWPTLEDFVPSQPSQFKVALVDLMESREINQGSGGRDPIALIRRLFAAQNCIVEEPFTNDPSESSDAFDVAVIGPITSNLDLQTACNLLERFSSLRVPVLFVLPCEWVSSAEAHKLQEASRHHDSLSVGFIQLGLESADISTGGTNQFPVIRLDYPVVYASTKVEYASSTGILLSLTHHDQTTTSPERAEYFSSQLRSALSDAELIGLKNEAQHAAFETAFDEVWNGPLAMIERNPPRLLVCLPSAQIRADDAATLASSGIPVLFHADDAQLRQRLGTAGISYRSPTELTQSAQLIYRTPSLWRQYSGANRANATTRSFEMTSADFYLSVRNFAAIN